MKFFYYLLVLAILITVPVSVSAQEEDTDWWNKSAKDTLNAGLLHSFEGSYAFARGDGNTAYKNTTGGVKLRLRKNIITSSTGGNISETETTEDDSTIIIRKHNINQEITLALFRRLDLNAGYMHKADDSSSIDERQIYYGGFSLYVFDSPKVYIDFEAGYGQEETTYDDDTNTKTTEKIVYFMQSFNWNITDNISFSDNAFGYGIMDDWEYYYYQITASLNFSLNEIVSLFAAYTIQYNKSEFTEVVNPEMHKKDTSFSTGITLNF